MVCKVSVVISVYQSHEIVRRQLLHFNKLNLPIEVIIVDDGSNPPIEGASVQTHSKIRWNVGHARNMGIEKAKGEYIFVTDIDHILSKEALEDALNFTGNKMIFRRQIAVLDENGNITQDPEILKDWGWRGDTLDASVHGNTWVMRKSTILELGGFDEWHENRHPGRKQGEDSKFNRKWNHKFREKPVVGRDVYHFPISRFNKDVSLNPKGLFYEL